MVQKSDLGIIEEEVRRLNRDFADPEDDGTYRTSVVLLSAALGGSSDVDDLAEFTGYPRDFIATISHRMHVAGLWKDGDVHDDHWWIDDRLEEIQPSGFLDGCPGREGMPGCQPNGRRKVQVLGCSVWAGAWGAGDVTLLLEFAKELSAALNIQFNIQPLVPEYGGNLLSCWSALPAARVVGRF